MQRPWAYLEKLATGLTDRHAAGAKSPIEETIEQKLVYIVFQPIVDLRTGKTFAQEGLARSATPHFQGPLDLFAAAVKESLCGRLGRILRQMAVDGAPEWPLFVNVNPNEFSEGWLVQPDDPIFWHEQPLYLEITESVPISHFAMCHGVLQEIRSKGIALAVDDLGAGFSNLKYIADLSPEVVKLDRELVAGLTPGSRQFRLVQHIVAMCQDLGARVVAEGIETIAELDAVIAAGAHFGQGYLLARPNTPAPAVDWPTIMAELAKFRGRS
jgi:EAL domain-containing protein (putative c-di-GMP-specific phosphodiesterase class I)